MFSLWHNQSPTVLILHIQETVNHQPASTAETHEAEQVGLSSFALHFQMQWHFLFVSASSFLREALCVHVDSHSTASLSAVFFVATFSRFLRRLQLSSVSKLVRSSPITQTQHPDR